MTQNRVFDFGSTLAQSKFKTLLQSLFSPGVYTGFDVVSASSTQIVLSAGAVLLPDGVLGTESTGIVLSGATTPPNPSSPTNYTLVADHADVAAIGGGPVSYSWVTGLQPLFGMPTATSVAVLYLRHPGSASLTAAMLSVPEKQRNDAIEGRASASQFVIPTTGFDVLKGSNITATPASHPSGYQYLGLALANSAPTGTLTYQFRLPVQGVNPRSVRVYGDIPNLGSISMTVGTYLTYTLTGDVVTASAALAGPVTGLVTPVGSITLGGYTGQITSLGFTCTIPAGTTLFIRGLEIVSD